MKKIYLIVIALLCSLLCIFGVNLFIKGKLKENQAKCIYYNNIRTKNNCDYIMDTVITENSIVVLGSSELYASDNLAYPSVLFNQGYSDFNMVLVGAGAMQSLSHAINLGALQNNIKNNKVVLILSPQWFTSGHLSPEAFSNRFSELNYIEFLQNDNISLETKRKISERVNELLISDPTVLERIQRYEAIHLDGEKNLFNLLELYSYSAFRNAKVTFELLEEVNNRNDSANYNCYVEADKIDYYNLRCEAVKLGEMSCTNNDYGIEDEYYETYIREKYANYKDSSSKASFLVSQEYDDLKLFLDVCKEMKIDPLIVNIPVNGRWYDYVGFSNADRNMYYHNICSICEEYGVQIADFSDKEYELYFLKDIMHLGWKGWGYLNEAVYDFYKGKKMESSTAYVELLSELERTTGTSEKEGTYTFTTNVEDNRFNSVIVQLYDEGGAPLTCIDIASGIGQRVGVYYHDEDSGVYKLNFRANSNKSDEYIQELLWLEKGGVYKYSYSVNAFGVNKICISEVSFSEIVYDFYGSNISESKEVYERLLDELDVSEGVDRIDEKSYVVTTDIEANKFNSVVFQVSKEKNVDLQIVDTAHGIGKRTGVYCHNMDTEMYIIRYRANSNLKDEYIEAKVYLESGGRYKFEYIVDELSATEVVIRNLSFMKIWK